MDAAGALAGFVPPSLHASSRMDVWDEAGGGSASVGRYRGERRAQGLLFMPPCLWSHSLVPAVTQAAAGKLKDPFPQGLETTLLL